MEINTQILSVIQNAQTISIYSHIKPDGDCLGSASALKLALLKLGKNVDCFCDSVISDNFLFLNETKNFNKKNYKNYDLSIAVDCMTISRMGKYQQQFKESKVTLQFDHHMGNDNYANYNVVENVGSTCEIIYNFLKQSNIELDKDIACCLYSGIASDTGGFMHANTTAQTHYITADLMEYNFDIDQTNYFLFKRRTLGQVKIMQAAINSMQTFLDGKLVVFCLKKSDFEKNNVLLYEIFGLVDIAGNIAGAEIGVLVSQDKENLYAVSMRSRGNVDVSKICKMFGGGGHKNASGCNIFGSNNTVINKIVKASTDYYDRFYKH